MLFLLSYGNVMMKWRKSEGMLPMPSRGTFGFRGRSGALVRFDFHDEIGSPGRSRTGAVRFKGECSAVELQGGKVVRSFSSHWRCWLVALHVCRVVTHKSSRLPRPRLRMKWSDTPVLPRVSLGPKPSGFADSLVSVDEKWMCIPGSHWVSGGCSSVARLFALCTV